MPIKLNIRPEGQLVVITEDTVSLEGKHVSAGVNVHIGSHRVIDGKVWYHIPYGDGFVWLPSKVFKTHK